jgi:hypothetical protein
MREHSLVRKSSLFCTALLLALGTLFGYAQAPVPFINQPLVPDATAPGGPDFTLTVNGTGFVSNSVVHWNGKALATTFISGSQLTATVPAAEIAKASTASVTVVNPAPGAGASNTAFFPIAVSTPAVAFSKSDFATGASPSSVVTADFNGDGKLDLAVTNFVANTVSVLLGNGDGSFRARVDYATGGGPDSVVARDFSGDGKLDLAVRNNIDNTVSILLGNGDGTFQQHVDFPTGLGPQRLSAGDFNVDGKLDLVVSNGDANTVSVLLGNGDGTFQEHVDYATGGYQPRSPWAISTATASSISLSPMRLPVRFPFYLEMATGHFTARSSIRLAGIPDG